MKIKDIAQMANVSVATVSRVLNGDPAVKESTQKRVQAVIKETGYKPNVMGRNLRKLKSGKILAIVPTIMNSIYSDIIQGVEKKAVLAGYDVMLVVSNRDAKLERKYLDALYTKEVDGVITFVSVLGDELLESTASQYPLVLCSGTTECEHLSYACIDNEKAAYDATKYLIGLGHTKVARINGGYGRVYELERNAGYERAMAEAGLQMPPEFMLDGGYSYKDGYAFARDLMALEEPPTAIFAFADTIASGCIKYLNEVGIKVGEDVDVMGFDNIELGEIISPTLTTVAQPLEELGSISFDLLLEKMENINAIRKAIIPKHRIVVRQSTRGK